MTREEIIQGLYRGDSRAIKEAIKALEQESIINFNAGEDIATLYTRDKPL